MPDARVEIQIAAGVRRRACIRNVPIDATTTPSTGMDYGSNGLPCGTKRKANDTFGAEEDAQLDNLARMMQDEQTELGRIKEGMRQYIVFETQQDAKIEKFYECRIDWL